MVVYVCPSCNGTRFIGWSKCQRCNGQGCLDTDNDPDDLFNFNGVV